MAHLLIVNPASADGGLEARARSFLRDLRTVSLRPDADVRSAIDEALSEGRVVVAAGGDGTVNAVAQHLVGRGTLGVLPAGTLNHFARDVGIQDMDAALRALAAGKTTTVDVGRAGGRIFVNNAGMGLYPEVVKEREEREDRVGRWLAAPGAAGRVLRRARPLVGTIIADGDARALAAWMVFFGNNRFGTAPGRVATREHLDHGVLDVRVLTVGRRRARTALAWKVLRSRQWRSRRLVRRDARRVEIRLDGPPRLVSRDGESGDPTNALDVEILPGALRVVTPPS